MQTALSAALPVFALILIGYICARRDWLGAHGMDVLNRFVIYLALPALLFLAMARIEWADLRQGGYVATLALSIGLTFVASLMLEPRPRPPLADRAIQALSASYANAGFMGIPLCLAVLGPESLPPAIIATLMTAGLQFAIVIAVVEIASQPSGQAWCAIGHTLGSLARNPLIAAPVLGCAYGALGAPLPTGVARLGELLANAASPCALVAIGMFLARPAQSHERLAVVHAVGLKLLLQPAIAAALAWWVFDMPPVWAATALLMMALPTGTGPFMLASMHGRSAATASRVILISTVLSVVTISALVAVIPR
ncbi:AEC family transporter [Verticiella sediminum]|uniref:AEC family transporter n=1 Tax=Verticiella sediminum TaxID=1247510 RepID=A0A556AFD8_9BURK|nr:AEC family transporter [Verticiella sediminum]TSH91598.1 AEC family transporter [Verticiella sediminum]